MPSFPQNAALILIDIQTGFDDPVWGRRNNPDAETNIATLLHAWRRTGRPIFHIQHLSLELQSPLRADSPGSEIKDMVRPQDGEPIIQKHVNSAFIGTDLEERLRRADISTLIITGLTTNHCVETTTRMAGNLGFHTYLVSDATATFDRRGPDNVLHSAEDIQAMTLTNLHEEFATIVTTGEVLRGLA
ncbi:MAG: cysteine hydrolase [Ktedonobacteraceae bacterium]|nr:cysteine hydrolase [Ktedonobacteraceae bacterium]